MNDEPADVRFFLDELAAMLAGTDPRNRGMKLGPGPAANSRSVAAFLVLGPEVIDAENTAADWLYPRYVENSERPGRDFLTSALRTVTPDSAKDLLYLGAGPGRYVVVTALGKPADKVTTYTFLDVAGRLGSGWRLDPVFVATTLADLTAHLDREGIEPGAPLGRRLLVGALTSASPA